MTGNRVEDTEDQALLAFLAAQRDAVLSIVAGLDEEAWHRKSAIEYGVLRREHWIGRGHRHRESQISRLSVYPRSIGRTAWAERRRTHE